MKRVPSRKQRLSPIMAAMSATKNMVGRCGKPWEPDQAPAILSGISEGSTGKKQSPKISAPTSG